MRTGGSTRERSTSPRSRSEAVTRAQHLRAGSSETANDLLVSYYPGLGFGEQSQVDLGWDAWTRLATLVGFNLGVELGQLAVVAAFLPIAFGLRASALYRLGFVGAGSLAVAGLASLWLAERSLGLTLLGF